MIKQHITTSLNIGHRRLRTITLQPERRSSQSLPTIRKRTKQNTRRTKHGANKVTVTDQEGSQLPEGWAQTRIGDICDLINGRAFKPTEWTSVGIPIIRIQNLNDPAAEFNYCNFKVEEKYLVDNGQLLFAWSGTPGTSFGAHIWNRSKAVLNQHIFKVNINENYLNKTFLKHLLNRNVKEYIGKAHGTAGLAHITKGKFEVSTILLPPFHEQERIASKVEELFSFLDAGTESLRKVQAQLKRYRQSVLKHAFEGKLTEHNPKDQDVKILLSLIREERQRKWKEDQTRRAITGRKYKELETAGEEKLPQSPTGWIWVRLEELCSVITDGTHITPKYFEKGVPFLSVKNVREGKIKVDEVKYISEIEHQKLTRNVQPELDDILYTKVGATIGRPQLCL